MLIVPPAGWDSYCLRIRILSLNKGFAITAGKWVGLVRLPTPRSLVFQLLRRVIWRQRLKWLALEGRISSIQGMNNSIYPLCKLWILICVNILKLSFKLEFSVLKFCLFLLLLKIKLFCMYLVIPKSFCLSLWFTDSFKLGSEITYHG